VVPVGVEMRNDQIVLFPQGADSATRLLVPLVDAHLDESLCELVIGRGT
jgi:hypothetical protein